MKFQRLSNRPSSRGRLRRRSIPIAAYVGPNGTGKSALMVYDTIPSLDFGRPVLSTVRLLDFRNPRKCDDPLCADGGHPDHFAQHPLYVPFVDYAQLLDWRDGDVLMDEVTGVASSRETSSMPVQVANYLVQMRRRNVALRWTAPAWGRADKIIREVTQGVTLTSAMLPKTAREQPGESPRLWTEKRLFAARTYDACLMDEFDSHRADDIPHLFASLYWGPGSLMFRAYDTYDAVTSLGWANDAGMCMKCAGKRTIHKCVCCCHLCGSANGRAHEDDCPTRTPRRPGEGPQGRPGRVEVSDLEPVAGR